MQRASPLVGMQKADTHATPVVYFSKGKETPNPWFVMCVSFREIKVHFYLPTGHYRLPLTCITEIHQFQTTSYVHE